MPSITLDNNEWQQVLAILATAPWHQANPLLMKIGNQLREYQSVKGNSIEVPAPSEQVGSKLEH